MTNLFIEVNISQNDKLKGFLTPLQIIDKDKKETTIIYVNIPKLCDDTDFFFNIFTKFDKKLEFILFVNETYDLFLKYLLEIHTKLRTDYTLEYLYNYIMLLHRIDSKLYRKYYTEFQDKIQKKLDIPNLSEYSNAELMRIVDIFDDEYNYNIKFDLSNIKFEVIKDDIIRTFEYKSTSELILFIKGVSYYNRRFFRKIKTFDMHDIDNNSIFRYTELDDSVQIEFIKIFGNSCNYKYLYSKCTENSRFKSNLMSVFNKEVRIGYGGEYQYENKHNDKYIYHGIRLLANTKEGEEIGLNLALRNYCEKTDIKDVLVINDIVLKYCIKCMEKQNNCSQ